MHSENVDILKFSLLYRHSMIYREFPNMNVDIYLVRIVLSMKLWIVQFAVLKFAGRIVEHNIRPVEGERI